MGHHLPGRHFYESGPISRARRALLSGAGSACSPADRDLPTPWARSVLIIETGHLDSQPANGSRPLLVRSLTIVFTGATLAATSHAPTQKQRTRACSTSRSPTTGHGRHHIVQDPNRRTASIVAFRRQPPDLAHRRTDLHAPRHHHAGGRDRSIAMGHVAWSWSPDNFQISGTWPPS